MNRQFVRSLRLIVITWLAFRGSVVALSQDHPKRESVVQIVGNSEFVVGEYIRVSLGDCSFERFLRVKGIDGIEKWTKKLPSDVVEVGDLCLDDKRRLHWTEVARAPESDAHLSFLVLRVVAADDQGNIRWSRDLCKFGGASRLGGFEGNRLSVHQDGGVVVVGPGAGVYRELSGSELYYKGNKIYYLSVEGEVKWTWDPEKDSLRAPAVARLSGDVAVGSDGSSLVVGFDIEDVLDSPWVSVLRKLDRNGAPIIEKPLGGRKEVFSVRRVEPNPGRGWVACGTVASEERGEQGVVLWIDPGGDIVAEQRVDGSDSLERSAPYLEAIIPIGGDFALAVGARGRRKLAFVSSRALTGDFPTDQLVEFGGGRIEDGVFLGRSGSFLRIRMIGASESSPWEGELWLSDPSSRR
jgi:hypothetical protein